MNIQICSKACTLSNKKILACISLQLNICVIYFFVLHIIILIHFEFYHVQVLREVNLQSITRLLLCLHTIIHIRPSVNMWATIFSKGWGNWKCSPILKLYLLVDVRFVIDCLDLANFV